MILTEAAEGGWGLAGTAYGVGEFAELAKKAAAAKGLTIPRHDYAKKAAARPWWSDGPAP